ncbi:hypothetical protein K438DRAFT_1959069 [Mycena galopus ATCC 62051]|nr:hypothetical protein K438DRAFT_1959069 [Mycena galopus ATCC 62051]
MYRRGRSTRSLDRPDSAPPSNVLFRALPVQKSSRQPSSFRIIPARPQSSVEIAIAERALDHVFLSAPVGSLCVPCDSTLPRRWMERDFVVEMEWEKRSCSRTRLRAQRQRESVFSGNLIPSAEYHRILYTRTSTARASPHDPPGSVPRAAICTRLALPTRPVHRM